MHRSRRVIAVASVLAVLSLSACGANHHGGDNVAGADMDPGMDHSAMGGMTMPMASGDGLSATHEGYTLTDLKAPRKAGAEETLSFTINGPGGKAHTAFTQSQTKLMHVYVIRKDLTQYQHIHPDLDTETGRWTVKMTFPEPGPYRVLTEFEALTDDGEFDARKLGDAFTIPGKYVPVGFEASETGAVDGFEISLEGEPKAGGGEMKLNFAKDGSGVSALQPYLESFAHITGFRQGDLMAVHMHPNEQPEKDDPASVGGPALALASLFPEPVTYRLFVEFKVDDELRLAPMDVDVT